VTYGVHKFHRFHTLTSHFYISRPIFVHRAAFDAWPDDLKVAIGNAVTDAVAFQRDLHVCEEEEARAAIAAAGCEIIELTADEHSAFAAAVWPIYTEAHRQYGDDVLALAGAATSLRSPRPTPVALPRPLPDPAPRAGEKRVGEAGG
jgi:TRAP-type transport system periplasmic protein